MSEPLIDEMCTHDCGTCAASCNVEKKGPSFFDRLEMISDAYNSLDEDEVLRILNETIAEWEREDAEAGAEAEETASLDG